MPQYPPDARTLLEMLRQQGNPLAGTPLTPGAGSPLGVLSDAPFYTSDAYDQQEANKRASSSSGMLAPSGVAPGGQGTAVGSGASTPRTPDELPLNLRTGPSSSDMPADEFLKSLHSPAAIPQMSAPQLPQEPNYPAPPQMAPLRHDFLGRLVAGMSGFGQIQNPFEAQREQQFKDALANWQAQVAPMRERYQEQVQQAELGPKLQGESIQNALALRRMAMMSGGGMDEAIRALGHLDANEQARIRGAMAEGDPRVMAREIDQITLQRNITGRNAMLARQAMGEISSRAGVTPEMDLAQQTKQLQAAVRAGQITPKEYDDFQAFASTQPFLPAARLSQAEVFAGPRNRLNEILTNRYNLSAAEAGIKLFEPAMGASTRLARMAINAPKAVAGNQQAMVALLMDHIGMTLGIQRGARITRDAILAAEQSRGLISGATSYLNFVRDPQTGEEVLNWQDPVRGGTTLTPQQVSQMMDLGQEQHRVTWTAARAQAAQGRSYGVEINEPDDIMEALAPGMTLQQPPVAPVSSKGAAPIAPKKSAQRPSLDSIMNPK